MEEAASSSRQPLVPRKAKINVPIGYRFKPRDDELIVHYLKPKAYNQPLPPNTIEEVELYSYNPEALTGRGTGDGFWKATGVDKQVRDQGKLEGLKKTLVYYRGKPPKGKKTNWIMHEYVLKDPPPTQRAGIHDMKLDNWVLCKVYNKKHGKKQDGETSGKGTTSGVVATPTADEDEGEGDGGAPPSKEEEEEQQFSITIAASPQIVVDQNQNHQIGGGKIMNPLQFYQHYNNMMLAQSSYPPPMPYYNSNNNGYNAAASTFGFSDFSECLGLGQDLPCYGNFVPKSSILPPPPQFDPTGSKYPLNMMINDPLQFPSFTEDEMNYLLDKLNNK
ncbi:No apical meristem (NAM) protein [Corchorus olitorius]|uniref:No apical meristem (NAM) protein n=1 Tax=Corchorus olitorius TaxID=93759 RepID=A0A1R3HF10_9ROSI|nr:No apical meristem (NAM) protein [Corchorus olitorius]